MKIEAEWMRGGTSKCWVFETGHLDEARTSLDELLPRLFGSPDSRQIDGVGGATSTTSKAMILHRPADEDVDVEFTFAQVGIEEAAVDWGSNCGNCSAVVGLYAIEKGWVVPNGRHHPDRHPQHQHRPDHHPARGHARQAPCPSFRMRRCPGSRSPATGSGSASRTRPARPPEACCPPVEPTDTITAGGTRWTVSMVDAGAPVVIVRAEELGLDASPLRQLARRSGTAAGNPGAHPPTGGRADGAGTNNAEAARAIPKLAIVASPHRFGP